MLRMRRGLNATKIGTMGNPDMALSHYPAEDVERWVRVIGIDNVRIPIEIGRILPGFVDTQTGQPSTPATIEHAVEKVREVIATRFAPFGLSVILCPFIAKEQQIAARYDGSWEDVLVRSTTTLLQQYGGQFNHRILGVQDTNEPWYDNSADGFMYRDWNPICARVHAELRRKYPNRTLVVSAPRYSKIEFVSYFDPPRDDGATIATLHVYDPSQLTLQGTGSVVDPGHIYPRGPNDGTKAWRMAWDYPKAESQMLSAVAWRDAHGLPTIIGELGCSGECDHDSRLAWWRDRIELADRYQFGWRMWDSVGAKMGLRPSNPNLERMHIALDEQGFDVEVEAILAASGGWARQSRRRYY
jgi:hypothetical protein